MRPDFPSHDGMGAQPVLTSHIFRYSDQAEGRTSTRIGQRRPVASFPCDFLFSYPGFRVAKTRRRTIRAASTRRRPAAAYGAQTDPAGGWIGAAATNLPKASVVAKICNVDGTVSA